MCLSCAPSAFDQASSDAFAQRLMGSINSAGLTLMISLGHRTGLFDALARLDHPTCRQVADEARLSERYVREWLGCMTCGRIVEHDPDKMTYHLPAEHASWLTRSAAPNNLAASMQFVGLLGEAETDVAEAFRHGNGVPYSAYPRFGEVMAEESSQTVVAGLDEFILPLVPELTDRLKRGIDVLDVGCGRGRAILHLARRYPRSRFIGCDFLAESIENATEVAARERLANARFERLDAADLAYTKAFDLVTTFDAIHDQAHPDRVLANIRRALKPGGVYLCQEIRGNSRHADNVDHPLGAYLYAISAMHCMSVSLAAGGKGLGAMWGRQLCQKMLADAGFSDVRMHELSHDIMNDWYVCRA